VPQLPRRPARLRLRIPGDRSCRGWASPSGRPTVCATPRAGTDCRRSSQAPAPTRSCSTRRRTPTWRYRRGVPLVAAVVRAGRVAFVDRSSRS
jgi:hypothetical protein